MADGFSPFAPEDDDDHDDLAALDFLVAEEDEQASELDAFDAFVQPAEPDVTEWQLAVGEGAPEGEEPAVLVFTVTNPPGTVSVSAYPDGRVERVRLAGVAKVTESQLAQEILLIADLARQKARSAQHATMLEEMRTLGYDSTATRDFLARELHLPSPEEATAAAAEFAVRYAGRHD